MMNHMETLPGKDWTDERELKELLKRADVECERRAHGRAPKSSAPKARTKPHFDDPLQEWFRAQAYAALRRHERRPADLDRVGKGRTKRLADISDEDFIRCLTEPQQLDLDETPSTHRKLEDIDDATFAKALTDPVTTNID
ncbi:hypothetical protein [Syntrophorhabdus aromaticivorans]|uniref:hypothetical protein n=1 Tax=Syntrophorhabdus aromaticivorans TaxID=328301 RepID=UPI00048A9F73|nr:hypothetical protein [Syntrophorhabdus aromaticivorans]